jgi:hypothetical protein
MASELTAVEQAVSRALRDNLSTLQRTAEEFRQAMDDLVSACASSRPTNAVPPMLRAQTAAASLAAALEVLSRFVTASLQPPQRTSAEEAVMRAISTAMPEAAPPPPPRIPTPMAEAPAPPPVQVAPPPPPPLVVEAPPPPPEPVVEQAMEEEVVEAPPPPPPVEAPAAVEEAFEVKNLPHDEQEMHRKANRHAKVSMQDIKLIRPEQVRLGRENRDLCIRLKDDIDKARKEYDRRFKAILNHPVDYFYDWMVQILADGDAEKLGEYPYPSPVHRR